MRKIFLTLLLIGILGLPFFGLAKSSAPDCETYCSDTNTYDPPTGKSCLCNPLKYDTFTDLVNAIIDFLFIVVLALSSLMIVIAGYYFVTASGDPKKIDTARKIILYTLIGLGIIMFAKAVNSILKLVIGLKQ